MKIGLNEAIVLQQLHYWLRDTNSGMECDGVRWIYNTTEQWLEQFPFWSESTLKRAFASLKTLGLLRCEKLNKSKRDMTNFYTINYGSELLDGGKLNESIGSKCAAPSGQNDTMEEVKMKRSIGSKRSNVIGSKWPDDLTENTTEITTENKNTFRPEASQPDPQTTEQDFLTRNSDAVVFSAKKRQWGSREDLACAQWIWGRIVGLYEQGVEFYSNTANEARKMLDMLDAGGQFTFQTFADRKDSTANLVRVFHGTLDSCSANLQDLNKQGAGIFVTINKTDLKGRSQSNVTDIRALFIDFDKVNPERVDTLQALPLPPSMIVESSPNKHHAYWILGSGEIALDDFKPLQKRLIGFFKDDGADNIHDLPRVLRLAGFYHQKNERNFTRVISTGSKYNADALKAWVNDLPQPIEAAQPPQKTKHYPTPKNRLLANTADESSKIEDALRFISPDCGYDDWYKIGAAVYSALGASGFDIWDRWSSRSSKYSPNGMQGKYSSFAGISDITAATVFKLAIDNGWKPPRQNDFENANAEILKFRVEFYSGHELKP